MTDTIITPTPDAPRDAGASGIRVATAVVGGMIAVLAIGLGAIAQFGVAGAVSSTTVEAIPASITSIEIDNTIGDVSIVTTPGAEPSIELRSDSIGWSRGPMPTVDIDGTELSVEVPDRDGPCFLWCGGSVTILVELGDIALDELDLHSDVGTIAVHEGVTVRDLSAESAVGDVSIDLVEATAIDVSSDVGTVQVRATEATMSITVETNVGDIEITVPEGLDYDVRAQSEIGDVETQVATTPSSTRSITATSDVGNLRLAVAIR